jgi:prepilin-type N-terminal cleavage/methylation domain-containing protein
MKYINKIILQSFKFQVSSLKSQVSTQVSSHRGFTLIELLIVFGLIGIITSLGFASFTSYNNQALQTSGAGVKDMLSVARLRALSQVKPSQCLNQTLSGYKVDIDVTSSKYMLNVVCDSIYILETKTLPKDITFRSDSTSSIFFSVLTGNPSAPAVIILVGYGKTHAITVDNTGSIALAADIIPTAAQIMPTPTSTECDWQEWWLCTSSQLSPAPTTVPTSYPIPTSAPIPTSIVSTATPIVPTPTPTRVPTAVPTPTPAPPVNIVLNTGFESGNSNWVDWGNSGAIQSNAHSGSYSMRMGTAAGGRAQNIGNSGGSSTRIVSGWGKVSTSSERGYIGVNYLNASGTQIGKQTLTYTSTTYGYQQVTLVVPSGTTTFQVWVWKDAGFGYFYADDISLTQ